MKKDKINSSLHTIKRLYGFIRPNRLWMYLMAFVCLLNAVMDILFAYILKPLTDGALNGDTKTMTGAAIVMLVLIPAGGGIIFAVRYSSSRLCFQIVRDIRKRISRHMESFTVAHMEGTHTGDMVSRLTNNTEAVNGFFEDNFYPAIYSTFIFIGSFSYLLTVNWKLLMASVILAPIAGYFTAKLSKPITGFTTEMQEGLAKVNAAAQDTIGGISMVKAFTLGDALYEKYSLHLGKAVESGLKLEKRTSLVLPIRIILGFGPFVLCVILGGYLTVKGQLTKGELISFIALVDKGIVGPMTHFVWHINSIRSLVGTGNHLFEILDQNGERNDGARFEVREGVAPVEMVGLSFAYEGQKNILEGFNLKLDQGKTIALVGPSGCGKSTVFKLICGFYEPGEGEIRVYDHNLKEWNLEAARDRISLVTQDTYLFPASIAENIGYGNPETAIDEIVRAAKAANAHEFIMELPDGYDTLVGERGIKLSGGQRQRISIARAVLKDAPVLLLDEPTSALDTQSEVLVQEALEKIMKDRCVIVIAHRLSTIKHADEVLVLNEGRVVEKGPHSALMESDGLYSQLYMKQFMVQGLQQDIA